jgi:hypothetical protein
MEDLVRAVESWRRNTTVLFETKDRVKAAERALKQALEAEANCQQQVDDSERKVRDLARKI